MPIFILKLLFLIIFVNLSKEIYGQPTITAITSEQIKDLGDSVELNCTVNNANDYSIVWIKNARDRPADNTIMSIGESLAIKDKRLKLTYDDNTTTYSLKIDNIQTTDNGFYECQILVSVTNKITSIVELYVRSPPVILENQTTSSVTVSTGQPFNLKCKADGYPKPTITWLREPGFFMPDGGFQFIGSDLSSSRAMKEYRGTYYCQASNGVGNPVRKTIILEIEFPPEIKAPRPKVAQAVNFEIELECVVEAYPPPAIDWLRKGVTLLGNKRYRISTVATNHNVHISVLRISQVVGEDYGDYSCRASNKLGQIETRMNLYESSEPDINFPGLIWISGATKTISKCTTTVLSIIMAIFLTFLI